MRSTAESECLRPPRCPRHNRGLSALWLGSKWVTFLDITQLLHNDPTVLLILQNTRWLTMKCHGQTTVDCVCWWVVRKTNTHAHMWLQFVWGIDMGLIHITGQNIRAYRKSSLFWKIIRSFFFTVWFLASHDETSDMGKMHFSLICYSHLSEQFMHGCV